MPTSAFGAHSPLPAMNQGPIYMSDSIQPEAYSNEDLDALEKLRQALEPKITDIVADLFVRLKDQIDFSLMAALTEKDRSKVRSHVAESILQMASPHFNANHQYAAAQKTGRINAISGLSQHDLLIGNEVLQSVLRDHVDPIAHDTALALFQKRSARALAWQANAYQAVQVAR